MTRVRDFMALLGATTPFTRAVPSRLGPVPPSIAIFSHNFSEPSPPLLQTEIKSHFMQHKYDVNVSHITAGYWYNSAAAGKVRLDEAYEGGFGSSLFDYTNTTSDGGVENKQWLVEPSVGSTPQCGVTSEAAPAFPLLTATILQDVDAVWGGVVNDDWLGKVYSWHALFYGAVPATIYLNQDNVVQGYDFWAPVRRTKAFTRFFNIEVGKIDPNVFDNFPC